MKNFSRKTSRQLKSYVYALLDPGTKEIFYVGKGSTPSRPFSHLKENKKKDYEELHERIKEIRRQGLEPYIEIIRYGLNDETAHEIEAAVIDIIGIENLTNSIRGHNIDRGRTHVDALEQQLGGKPANIEDMNFSAILLYCHHAYPKFNLYDATRQFWNLSKNRIMKKNLESRYQYAFAMRGSIVLNIYKILKWYPAGSTISSRTFKDDGKTRWEFIGAPAEKPILKAYKNRILHQNGSILHAPQRGVRYLN